MIIRSLEAPAGFCVKVLRLSVERFACNLEADMATTATKDGQVTLWQGRKSEVTHVQFAPAYRLLLLDAPGLFPDCLRQRRNTFGGFIG